MPKSKHRKNQKQKSRARTERIKGEQRRAQKFSRRFHERGGNIKDQTMEIEELVQDNK